jgi:hypothetical protein
MVAAAVELVATVVLVQEIKVVTEDLAAVEAVLLQLQLL